MTDIIRRSDPVSQRPMASGIPQFLGSLAAKAAVGAVDYDTVRAQEQLEQQHMDAQRAHEQQLNAMRAVVVSLRQQQTRIENQDKMLGTAAKYLLFLLIIVVFIAGYLFWCHSAAMKEQQEAYIELVRQQMMQTEQARQQQLYGGVTYSSVGMAGAVAGGVIVGGAAVDWLLKSHH